MTTMIFMALTFSGIFSLIAGLFGCIVAILVIMWQMIFGTGVFEVTVDDPYSIKHWRN